MTRAETFERLEALRYEISDAVVWPQDLAHYHAAIATLDVALAALREDQAEREKAAREAQEEIARLRSGLQWYANGEHYDLTDWDSCSGESGNWLFPDARLVLGDPSWMIDNGGIAKAVLNGAWVNPNRLDADNITLGQIETEDEHAQVMARIEELMPADPAPDTPAGQELGLLARYAEEYEKRHFNLEAK